MHQRFIEIQHEARLAMIIRVQLGQQLGSVNIHLRLIVKLFLHRRLRLDRPWLSVFWCQTAAHEAKAVEQRFRAGLERSLLGIIVVVFMESAVLADM